MEKKKFLLVAVSVGVFLVIVIGVTILLTTPKNGLDLAQSENLPVSPGRPGQSGEISQGSVPATADASTMVRNPGGVQGLESPPAVPAQPDSIFYVYGENSSGQPALDQDARTRAVIEVPKPSAAAVPDTAVTPPRREPAERPVRAAEAVTPARTPARTPPAVAATPAPVRTRSDYWVQTGAFSTKARADGVKETLASKGINSVVDVQDINSKTYYRVRVGPYTSESEAGYWLSLVKTIDGFGESQIRVSQSRH
ncbi:MAG: SPOR domain-containing protein [Spirochaetaceae bacterium]|jgi:DedD protein|nr:SPOR domain-containing protein [Spirochaetaceae bacterium]